MLIKEININKAVGIQAPDEEISFQTYEMCKFCNGWSSPIELVSIHLLDSNGETYSHEIIHEVCGLLAMEDGKVFSDCNCEELHEPWV